MLTAVCIVAIGLLAWTLLRDLLKKQQREFMALRRERWNAILSKDDQLDDQHDPHSPGPGDRQDE